MNVNKQKNIRNRVFFQDAKRFVSSVKKREQISNLEITNSWNEIERKLSSENPVKNRVKRKSYFYYLAGSAAAILLLCVAMPGLMERKPSGPVVSELQCNSLSVDSLTEIALVTAEDSIMNIEDKSTVDYRSNGTLTVNNKRVASVSSVKLNHLFVPRGRRVKLTFSDGTRMFVNAGSHVVYPAVFDKEKREIEVEGEVFLEVAHNPDCPFIVKTAKCDVKVLGTVFNVSAYKDEEQASVVLVNGSVEVETKNKEKVLLHPDEMISVYAEKTDLKKVDVFKYICWKDNIMLLDDDQVGKVMDNLARYYGVKVWCSRSISDIRISGKLDLCENVEDVFGTIQESASIRLRKIDGGGFYLTEK